MSEEETFKVTDRRRRVGDDPASDAAPAEPAAPAPERPPATAASPPASSPLDPAGAGPDLQGVFAMFASSALIALGAAPDPATGEHFIDLEQAREIIETLLLLRGKTEGNRTEAESRALEDILYELQVRFVHVSQGGR